MRTYILSKSPLHRPCHFTPLLNISRVIYCTTPHISYNKSTKRTPLLFNYENISRDPFQRHIEVTAAVESGGKSITNKKNYYIGLLVVAVVIALCFVWSGIRGDVAEFINNFLLEQTEITRFLYCATLLFVILSKNKAILQHLFTILTPGKERIRLILNVEAQKKFRPGYDLVTRGIYYGARMISSQKERESVK